MLFEPAVCEDLDLHVAIFILGERMKGDGNFIVVHKLTIIESIKK